MLGNRHSKALGEFARKILADNWDVIEAKQAMAAGAAGYSTKESAGQELYQLLSRLLHKSTHYDIY
jgi:DNA-binding NarL/FixJ family response regulator